jgi:hypothetical protein
MIVAGGDFAGRPARIAERRALRSAFSAPGARSINDPDQTHYLAQQEAEPVSPNRSRQFDWRLRNPEKSPAGRGAEKQGAEMQGQVYPPPPNLPRRVPELGNALSSVVFVNYEPAT